MRTKSVIEQELSVEVEESGRRQSFNRGDGNGPTMSIPPEPPAKEVLKRSGILSPRTSPTRPPSRPLPPTPSTRPSEAPSIPQPTRPPPLRPQAPLAMNPPTRPGTAQTQTSGTRAPLRFPGSTKRLSWTSIASRRPIKYGQGKYSRVELVPQPSDDPDDPLVGLTLMFSWSLGLTILRIGRLGGKS